MRILEAEGLNWKDGRVDGWKKYFHATFHFSDSTLPLFHFSTLPIPVFHSSDSSLPVFQWYYTILSVSPQISIRKNFRNATVVSTIAKKQSSSRSRAACWSVSPKVGSTSGGGSIVDGISSMLWCPKPPSDILLNISASSVS